MRWALAIVAASLSCRTAPEVTAEQVAVCVDAVASAAGQRGDPALVTLADGCAGICPGLAALGSRPAADLTGDAMTAFMAGCDLFCSERARQVWERSAMTDRFAAVVEVCGDGYYGAKGGALSASWLVLRRTQAWLDRHIGRAERTTRRRLVQLAEDARFILPMPAQMPDAYRLPAARASRASGAQVYAVVAQRAIRASVMPQIPFTAAALAGASAPALGPELLAPAREIRAMFAQSQGDGQPAELLVLADRALPADRLIEAAAAMEQYRFTLGVAGHSARAHPVTIELLITRGSAAPLLEQGSAEWIVVGASDERRIPRGPAALDRLARELSALSVRWAPQNKLEVALRPTTTVADLTALLDVVAQSKFAVALIQAPLAQ